MIMFFHRFFLFVALYSVLVEGDYTIEEGCSIINKALAQLAINDAFKLAQSESRNLVPR
jgi:hypothetical protein